MESSRGKAGHAQGKQSPVVCGGETQIEQLILLKLMKYRAMEKILAVRRANSVTLNKINMERNLSFVIYFCI